MESLPHILAGFAVAVQPANLLFVLIGVTVGTIIGVLPGIGPSAGIALLIPLTFGMDPTAALIMLTGIYYGAMYGGSITSILVNTPGEASSVMTAIDGHQMTRNGRAGAALAVAAIGSFFAGTVGIVLLSLAAVPLTKFALRFGPAEYFALMIFVLSAVSSMTGGSLGRAIIATTLGLMIATIGIDLQSGLPRFTFGVPELMEGIDFLIVVVGLFAITEVFRGFEALRQGTVAPSRLTGTLWLTREEWRRSVPAILRGTGLGFAVGVLPGAGATIASILSYVTERKLAREPERFGKGAIEGVAGPESANNAASAGAMVPLLSLGIPGSGATAIILAAFVMYGIQPGPMLFQARPDLVWGLVASMYIGNVVLLLLNLPLVGVFARLLYVPSHLLMPMILGFGVTGVYALNTLDFELYLLIGFGVLGYLFAWARIPAAPLVLALVLGDAMEQSFRQALTISDGNPAIFVASPISATLIGLTVLSLVLPPLLQRKR
ncbi:MAG: tripartite tricarboxylate transporter permease [Alphaproteobacteria bacterium]|nr:tripartite tricarboxylate transporter permease [Alphaproteobacteria bacterium]